MGSGIITLDTHIDIPWAECDSDGLPVWMVTDQCDVWPDGTELSKTKRRFTIPGARKGGLNAACLAAYIPQGPLTEKGHEAAWRRCQAMLGEITAYHVRKDGQVALCRTAEAIENAVLAKNFAVIAAVENGYAIGEDLGRLYLLAYDYGVRYMTLTHNGHNLLADSAVIKSGSKERPERHGGLSLLGREAVAVMNRAGILVDVSHTSRKTMMQAVKYSETPVIASHSCVRSLCDHPRNLDDGQLDALKECGGVIQITAMGPFLRKGGGGDVCDLVAHLHYVIRRIGIAHVGLSSDFDGGGHIPGWENAAETGALDQVLIESGFDLSERRAIWGGNMMRLMRQAEDHAEKGR